MQAKPFGFQAHDWSVDAFKGSRVAYGLSQFPIVIKDSNGEPFGQAMFDAYQKPEGQMTEVSYVWPRPGSDKTPEPKVSFVTKVGDLGCGVGYYK
jgi:hypothetical protein